MGTARAEPVHGLFQPLLDLGSVDRGAWGAADRKSFHTPYSRRPGGGREWVSMRILGAPPCRRDANDKVPGEALVPGTLSSIASRAGGQRLPAGRQAESGRVELRGEPGQGERGEHQAEIAQ